MTVKTASTHYTRRSPKRAAIKGILLSLVVNGFIIFADYQQHGFVSSHDWIQVTISVGVSIAVIVGLAFIFDRLLKSGKIRSGL